MTRLLLLLALSVGAGDLAAQTGVDPGSARYRVGDDAGWASPDADDWPRGWLHAPPDTHAVLWLRLDAEVGPDARRPLGLAVSAVAAREVYWDGVLVGASGRVGTDRASEVPGPIDTRHAIPDSLATPGPHVVALRMSTFRRAPSIGGYVHGVNLAGLEALVAWPLASTLLPLLFLGGFVLVGLYYGVLFAADRSRTPYLLTAALCLAVAALLGAESWRWVVGYTYDHHITRLVTVTALTWLVGVLLVATFAVQFELPRRGRVVAGVAGASGLALAVPGGYDPVALAMIVVALVAALAVTAWATARGRSGARFALGGVAICLGTVTATGLGFLDQAFFPAFAVLVASLLASLGLQTRDQRRRHQAALAQAARLEVEVVKSALQPHFLMNTLTSVIEWVETDPATGVRVLEALAEELRLLAEVAGETTVPLARELALCRTHLDVMGYRRDVRFHLDADGVDLEAPIPPATLHTLVENAITHNAYPPGDVRFALSESRADGHRRYTLTTPLADAPEVRPERGGLRYVRARLEESFPGRWALRSDASADAWVTTLELPCAS
ncbi:histidine kinase [Rubrivirga sp. IMCC43871]|uniref:histidine kinase n=1 Tax=Rubrivirga sp. IMCC43871 TaxID=3391575 RepID=UPI00398F905C